MALLAKLTGQVSDDDEGADDDAQPAHDNDEEDDDSQFRGSQSLSEAEAELFAGFSHLARPSRPVQPKVRPVIVSRQCNARLTLLGSDRYLSPTP
jgi:hypothetical protein